MSQHWFAVERPSPSARERVRGTRNPMVVHWPKGIKAKGEARTQFHHVIDVVPTITRLGGLPPCASSRD